MRCFSSAPICEIKTAISRFKSVFRDDALTFLHTNMAKIEGSVGGGMMRNSLLAHL